MRLDSPFTSSVSKCQDFSPLCKQKLHVEMRKLAVVSQKKRRGFAGGLRQPSALPKQTAMAAPRVPPASIRRMTLYVNNKTAMRFWCMVASSLEDVTNPCTICEVKNASTTLRSIDPNSLEGLVDGSHVVHLLVGDPNQRTQSPRFEYHLRTKAYPLGAFRRLSHDVLVASPELCFIEMANTLPFFKLVEFGYLLCGTYTLNPEVESPNKRKPLTTKRKLASFIDRMGNARGCAIARKALDFAIEGSASVRETKTTILLCTPSRLGGYGLNWPELNYRIDFTEEEQRMFGRPYVVIDLYWHASYFGLEYDGEKGHSEEADVSRDRRKDSELSYHGIRILRVDKVQLANPFQVYVLAKKCGRALGKTIRKPTQRQLEARRELFNAIMR